MTLTYDRIVELYLNNGWRDVSADVRYNNGRAIQITTGMQEMAQTINSNCEMTFDNRSGNYSPRNPASSWYGYLKRNTKIRIGTRILRDLYISRTATNGWGTASSQSPLTFTWSTTGGVAGDFAVAAGVGTHSLSSTAGRRCYLPTVALGNVEVRGTFQLPFSAPTGGNVYVNVFLRDTGSNHYAAQIGIAPTGAVTVQFYDYNGNGVGSPTTVAGLTYSGQTIRYAVHLDGEVFRAKVWAAASLEPYAWTLEDRGYSTQTPGYIDIESAKASGNTNGTFSVSHTNVELIVREFVGEVAEWPPTRDTSGKDMTVSVTANGITRRLRTGLTTKPIKSPAYRGMSTLASLQAYWPCEDGSSATQFLSYRSDWPTLAFFSGKPNLAASTAFPASLPLPKINQSRWAGDVPLYTVPSPAVIQLRCLVLIDTSGEPANNATLIHFGNAATAAYWVIRYVTGGQLTLEVQDSTHAVIYTVTYGMDLRGIAYRLSLQCTQNGANVDYTLAIADTTSTNTVSNSGTVTGVTVGMVQYVDVGTDFNAGTATVIGHITVQSAITSLTDLQSQLYAWRGEAAPSRALRVLSTEEGIPFHLDGDLTTAVTMGIQPTSSVMGIFDQVVAADLGLAFEPHYHQAVGYMTNNVLTDRTSLLTLDYSAHQLFGSLSVMDDDQYTVNDVTVQQSNGAAYTGSTVHVAQTTGALSTAAPEAGGVGLYDKSYQLNCDTPATVADLAGWILAAGTVDQPRIPKMTLYLHNSRIQASVATLMAAWDVREGSFVTVANIPTAISADDLFQVVIGAQKRLTQVEHEVTWNCAPGDVWRVARMDDGYYVVEPEAAFLAANCTNSATTISVKSNDGTLFTTTDVPFTIRIGGEQMTVTAVTGSSSPQTFTVTRGVNRITLAHTADDSELARVTIVTRAAMALS